MYDFIDKPYKQEAIEIIKKRIGRDQINYIYSKKPLETISIKNIPAKAILGSVMHKRFILKSGLLLDFYIEKILK